MKEFISHDDYIYVNTAYAEAYIPEDLFDDADKDSAVAAEYGEYIRTIGIFNMRFFDSDDSPRDKAPIRTFNYPNVIETYPSEYAKEKLMLPGDVEPQMYRVLKYYKGDIMMDSQIKQDSKNCERFLNMLTKGKFPNTIKYDDLLLIWLKNFQINNVNPGVPAVTEQVIISEMCRNKDNPLEQFRKVVGTGKYNPNGYIASNMNDVSSFTSVFSALTFERFGDKLTTSLNMTNSDAKQTRSPIEKVLSM